MRIALIKTIKATQKKERKKKIMTSSYKKSTYNKSAQKYLVSVFCISFSVCYTE